MADDKSAAAPEQRAVLRDQTFARAVADKVLVLDLGRDVELACVQVGPVLSSYAAHSDGDEVNMEPVWTEVVRLRLPWPGAVGLAMQVLDQAIDADRVHGDKVIELLSKKIAEASSDASETVEGRNGN